MSKKEVAHCVFQFDIEVDQKAITWLETLVLNELKKYHASMVSRYTIRPHEKGLFEGSVYLEFFLNLTDNTNRAKDKAVYTPIKKITIWYRKLRGFEDYITTVELEKEGKKTLENTTRECYEVNIWTDGKVRPYRKKHYRKYEPKKHFTWNTDCNREFEDEICIALEDIMNCKGWYLPDEYETEDLAI